MGKIARLETSVMCYQYTFRNTQEESRYQLPITFLLNVLPCHS